MYKDEMQEVLNKLKVFENMYEIIRFVDPISKKVVNYKNNSINELSIKCFDFWGTDKMCNNCISIRSFNENETFVKVEYSKEKIYMITAIPIELSDRRIVIELLMDTTKSLVFGASEGYDTSKSEVYTIIDSMNNLAFKDALTGGYNRRFINEKLPINLIGSAFQEQNLSIIITDIDYFKSVNDIHGHIAGDCVIKGFAEVLSGCIKEQDEWVARFGGEEFLICLPGVNLESAVQIAELMRSSIEEKEFLCAENKLKITASFGVYSLKPNKDDNIENLIQHADRKLYLAKKNGRNRVEY